MPTQEELNLIDKSFDWAKEKAINEEDKKKVEDFKEEFDRLKGKYLDAQEKRLEKDLPKVKSLTFKISLHDPETNKELASKNINSNWSLIPENFGHDFKVNVWDEISAIISENIALDLTPERIKNLLSEALEKGEGNE